MNYLRQAESNLEERVDSLLMVVRNKKFTFRKLAGYLAVYTFVLLALCSAYHACH